MKIIRQFSISNQNGKFPFDYKFRIKLILFRFLWMFYEKQLPFFICVCWLPPCTLFSLQAFPSMLCKSINWYSSDTELLFPFLFQFNRTLQTAVRTNFEPSHCFIHPQSLFLCERTPLWKDEAQNQLPLHKGHILPAHRCGSIVPLSRLKRRKEASLELAWLMVPLRNIPLQLFCANEGVIGKFC